MTVNTQDDNDMKWFTRLVQYFIYQYTKYNDTDSVLKED